MSILWTDPRGHKLIAAALFMQITGMLVVRKILRIKFSFQFSVVSFQ